MKIRLSFVSNSSSSSYIISLPYDEKDETGILKLPKSLFTIYKTEDEIKEVLFDQIYLFDELSLDDQKELKKLSIREIYNIMINDTNGIYTDYVVDIIKNTLDSMDKNNGLLIVDIEQGETNKFLNSLCNGNVNNTKVIYGRY